MNNTLHSNVQAAPAILLTKAEGIIWCVMFAAETFAVVTLNVSTLLVFLSNKHLRKRNMFLLINLTMVDLLVGSISMPDHFVTFGRRFGFWAPNVIPALEITFSGFYLLTLSLSLTNLAAIALERFHATVYPFSYQTTRDWQYFAVIGLVWSISGLITGILMILFYSYAGTDRRDYWLARLMFILSLLFIISFSYAVIFRRARPGHYENRKGSSHHQRNRQTLREKRLTKMLFIVTAVSLVTWLPFVIFATLATANVLSKLSLASGLRANIICAMLYYFNSMVNPIIYSYRLPRFRNALFKREKKKKKPGFYTIKNVRQSESSC